MFPMPTCATRSPYQLSKAYGLAGQPEQATAAIDAALAIRRRHGAEKIDLPVYRTEQAENCARRGGRISALAPALTAARRRSTRAGCPERDRKALGDYIGQRATEAHSIYAP